MVDMNRLDEYLERIEVNHPTDRCTEEYLNQLHIGHLTHIPFETFDLIDIKELKISIDYCFDRLVRQKRGGVCFQMNGVFAYILKKLDYNIKIIPCCVYNEIRNTYAEPASHVALYITLNNGKTLLCDVGFSKDFLTPLFFRMDCVQYATNGFFRLIKIDNGLNYQLQRGIPNVDDNISLPILSSPQTHIIDIDPERLKWIASYRFPIDFLEREIKIDDFQSVCSHVVHSPDVILNHCTICHIHTYKPMIGAYDIVGKEYGETIVENGKRIRQSYTISNKTDGELKKLLKEKFNLTIERKIELVSVEK